MPVDEELDQVLRFDGLDAAEKITGNSYKEDKATMALGFLLFSTNNDRKQELLDERDDTHFNTSFADALRIYQDEGFKVVYDEEFFGSNGATEHYVILWRDGILAAVESYNWGIADEAPRINKSEIYFNLKLNESNIYPRLPFSGGLTKDRTVLVAHIDVREGLRHTLRKMEEAGTPLSSWVEQPFLWLINYNRVKSLSRDALNDHKKLTDEMIQKLPEEVRSAIQPQTDKVER
jgi:hypothetical protein